MITIMIVDDEPLVRASVQSFLNWKEEGFTFLCEASNGVEALEELKEHPVDLVLLDIHMPVMDGLEFLEKLQTRPDAPKVIVLSANDHYSYVRRAFQLGALDYILKSDLDESTLLDLLNRKKKEVNPGIKSQSLIQISDTEYLKQRLLLDLLDNRNPELTLSMLKDLGIEISFPCRICFLWTNEKSEDTVIGMLRMNASQHMKKRNIGGTFFITQEGQVFFLLEVVKNHDASQSYCDSFCRDFIEIIRDGLDLTLNYALSCSCESISELPGQYQYTLSLRSIESRMIRKAKKYIRRNYASPRLSLEEVSDHVQISKAHLSSQFRKETGIYLQRLSDKNTYRQS